MRQKVVPLDKNGFDYKDMNDLIDRMTDEDKKKIEIISRAENAEGVLDIESVKKKHLYLSLNRILYVLA